MSSYFNKLPNLEYVNRTKGNTQLSDYITVKNLFKKGYLRPDIFQDLSFFSKYQIIADERPDQIANLFYGSSTYDWLVYLSNNILNPTHEWPMPQETFNDYLLNKYGSYEKIYDIRHYETKEIKNSLGVTLLKGGLEMSPTWKTNGNFIEVINSKISSIFAGDGEITSTTVTVVTQNGIVGLEVGTPIVINNVSEFEYNGTFIVSTIQSFDTFTYELSTAPPVPAPILSSEDVNERIEEVNFTLRNSIYGGNAYYFEYYDPFKEQTVQISSGFFLTPVTNYDYEEKIQEERRNIYLLKPQYLSVVLDDIEEIMTYKEGSTQFVSETLKRGDNIRLFS